MKEIVPSLLSADFSILAEQVALMEEAGAKRLHFDVMDGHFVKNLTFGAPLIASLRNKSKLHFEAHLMVSNPEERIDEFLEVGTDTLIIHAEATNHLHGLIGKIKSAGVKAGVCINPATPLSALDEILDDADFLLIMTVNPGFGGQKMIKSSLAKVKKIKEKYSSDKLLVEIDGGISLETVAEAAGVGTDLLVSGSAIFKSDNPLEMFHNLTEAANAGAM
ncbi:MAG: ribulose-phosphate 3-epimerase [Candidatus Marinimicrobia bacterium]|nr:ribulose-phosphate 3-epimerase [Candidatus Neomarinimicrobiota bacterium]